MMTTLQEVWQAHPHCSTDPTRSFALSWKRLELKAKFKEIKEVKESEELLANLYDKLMQLKFDILEDSSLFQKEEFQELQMQIPEVELNEANRICNFSIVKWLGTADEPRKLFFALL